MKAKTSISTIHRAEVEIPEALYRRIGDSPEYQRQTFSAVVGCAASGQDRYSGIIEWVEDSDLVKCKAFIESWLSFIEEAQQ